MPAKANSGRSSSRANHTGVLRGLVSAYSLKAETGTRQRYSGFSQGRQYGEATLRTFVTGCVPTLGGGGKPQRIMLSSRPSSRRHTTGAIWSGKIPGNGGRLPIRSSVTPSLADGVLALVQAVEIAHVAIIAARRLS